MSNERFQARLKSNSQVFKVLLKLIIFLQVKIRSHFKIGFHYDNNILLNRRTSWNCGSPWWSFNESYGITVCRLMHLNQLLEMFRSFRYIINDIMGILLIFETLNSSTHFFICVGISAQYRKAIREMFGLKKKKLKTVGSTWI